MEKRYFGEVNKTRPETADMVYGVRAVVEAIRSGQEIEKLLLVQGQHNLAEVKEAASEKFIRYQVVPEEKLNRYTRKNHQGVICFISPIRYAKLGNLVIEAFERGEDPFILILDRVTDVRNFGAIARTAECAGVHALVIPSRGGALINADAVKTSAGALSYIPVCKEDNLKNTLTFLAESGLKLVGCTEKASASLYEVSLKGPLAIIMGSEEDGISPEYLKLCDEQVHIPLMGQIESLNVSVASGVVLYEAIRQKNTA